MMFLFRSILIGILRFIVSMTLLISLFYLETSPFPEAATYTVLSYLIHFGTTLLFAWWVFGRHAPSTRDASIVFVTFSIVTVVSEMVMSVWIAGASPIDVLYTLQWQSLAVFAVYALAVFLAAWHVRKTTVSTLPEGMTR